MWACLHLKLQLVSTLVATLNVDTCVVTLCGQPVLLLLSFHVDTGTGCLKMATWLLKDMNMKRSAAWTILSKTRPWQYFHNSSNLNVDTGTGCLKMLTVPLVVSTFGHRWQLEREKSMKSCLGQGHVGSNLNLKCMNWLPQNADSCGNQNVKSVNPQFETVGHKMSEF